MYCYTTPTRVPNLRSRTHFPELHSPAYVLDLDSLPISSNSATSNKPKPYPYSTYHNSDNTLSFDHFPDLRSGSGSTSSTDPEPNPEPYAYAYHYVDEILSFVELSDGSFKVPFAYHFDITNIRLYFVEFEDGSVVTVTQVGPDSCVKSNDEYLVVDNYRLQYEWNGDGEVARILQYQLNNNAETEKKKIEPKYSGKGDKQGVEVSQPRNTSGSANISMDRLREELTCAICLEICFEPSTTTCGHSFCCECLRSAADICGNRCPKCRQFISKRRSCTVNTVLWNTIQLLFPDVVEGRKAAAALNSGETHYRNAIRTDSHSNIFTPAEMLRIGEEFSSRIWTEVPPSQDEDGDEDVDAALAVRLQTMYFLETSSLGDSEAWPDDWPLH